MARHSVHIASVARQRGALRLAIRVAALLLAAGTVCSASEEADTDADAADDWRERRRRAAGARWLVVTGIDGEIGFRYDYRSERFSGAGRGDRHRLDTYREYLRAHVGGYIYHRRLIKFDLEGELNLVQLDSDGSERSRGNDNDEYADYNARVVFLDERPVSLTIGAQRDTALPSSAFDSRVAFRSEKQYATLRLNSQRLPAFVHVERREEESRSLDSVRKSLVERLEARILYNMAPRSRSELAYEWEKIEQKTRGASLGAGDRTLRIDTRYWSVYGYDYRRFGSDRRYNVNTDFRVRRQDEPFDVDLSYLRQRLVADWTRRFRTHAFYLAQRVDNNKTETDSLSGEAGLRHQLYESLVTRLNVHGRTESDGGFEGRSYGTRLDVDYGKATPLGYLTLGYGVGWDRTKYEFEDVRRVVNDEPFVMRLSARAPLRRSNVLSEQVRVISLNRQVSYVRDLDYRLTEGGDRVFLERLVSGSITEGQTVLVTYTYENDETDKIDRLTQRANARHDFGDRASLYTRWRWTDNDRPARSSQGVTDESDGLVGGRIRWGCFEAIQEYEQYRSNVYDYDLWRSELQVSKRLTRRTRSALSIQYRDQDYEGADDLSHEALSVTGTHYWHTPFGARWSNQVSYTRDTGDADLTYWTVSSQARARIRRVDVSMGVRFQERESFGSERDRSHVFFQVARRFGSRP